MKNKNKFRHQKGFGLISVIIFLALLFAAVNAYAYFNPSFSLARYSPLNYIRAKKDEVKKQDLNKIKEALQKYYQKNNDFPGSVGTCGRISSTVYHSEIRNALNDAFPENKFPTDPSFVGTDKDYFYARTNEGFVLMAVLEIAPQIPDEQKSRYNFTGCWDWPGDNVYNYRVDGSSI